MKQTVLPRNEELLEKYYKYHETQINAGKSSPFNGIERCTLEMMMNWLCERYIITSKQKKKG